MAVVDRIPPQGHACGKAMEPMDRWDGQPNPAYVQLQLNAIVSRLAAAVSLPRFRWVHCSP